jgi:hypothetical protein
MSATALSSSRTSSVYRATTQSTSVVGPAFPVALNEPVTTVCRYDLPHCPWIIERMFDRGRTLDT